MKKQMLIVGAALIALPTLSSAQARAEAQGSAVLRGESRASAEEDGTTHARGSGSAAVRAAVRAGLPEAPVRRVIAEGEAKGASAAQVNRAALDVVARLHASRDALRDGSREREPSRAEIVAGAEALSAGATRADLRVLRESAPAERSLTASLTTLAELRAHAAHGDGAVAAVAAQLARGASDGAIRSLSVGAVADTGLGAPRGIGGALDAAVDVAGTVGAAGGALDLGAAVTGVIRGGGR